MAMQGRLDQTNFQFIREGDSRVKDNETLLQDAGRAADLKQFTVMGKVAASGKWVPLTDLAAVDGTAIARGIYLGDDVATADLVAGDVEGALILVGGNCTVDSSLLVFENALTLASVRDTADLGDACVVEDDLARFGIFTESVIDIDELENS